MIVELIVMCAVGLLCVVLGLLIWKKQMISLVHDYHHRHVRPEDVPAYTRLVGIGLLLIGAGILLTEIIDLVTGTLWGWLAFGAGFVAGIALMQRAQTKYNGSLFG